jgi:hypothetical protein
MIARRTMNATAALATTMSCLSAHAGEANPHVWSPKTKSVAVFKDGLGFFVREGDVALRDGWCMAREVPPAAFGTLAVYAHDEERMVDLVGTGDAQSVAFDGIDAPDDVAERQRRLEAAKGLRVRLTTGGDDGSPRAAAEGIVRSIGPEFVVLEDAGPHYAVDIDEIRTLELLQLPLRVHVAAGDADAAGDTTLGMAYLRKGITWIPEYTLRIIDDEYAELTLRGTLINHAEDIVHADVHFVVGVPSFAHAEYLSPLAVGQVIRAVGAAVAPPEVRTQIMSRAAVTSNLQTADQFAHRGGAPAPGDGGGAIDHALSALPKLQSAAANDYTVYTKSDLTIRRGERMMVSLFRTTIRYGHIYRWSPPGRVRHHLVLENMTDTSWTTGPALAVSGPQPLGEDLIRYTPAGGRCELPVTAAVNVASETSEAETGRKFKAYALSSGRHLDLVTLRGELRLRNFESEPVTIAIDLTVPGRPGSVTDDGVTKQDATKLELTKRAGTIRWRLELAPGATKTLQYEYERYVKTP